MLALRGRRGAEVRNPTLAVWVVELAGEPLEHRRRLVNRAPTPLGIDQFMPCYRQQPGLGLLKRRAFAPLV